MKKSLSKILARMAKDGDIETVAEIIEEMIEPEAAAEETAEAVAEAAAEAAEDPAAVVETPEGATVVVDEATLGDIISMLDQIISLLTPAAADEDPVEEIAEAVEEAVEAAIAAEGEVLEDEEEGKLPVGTSQAEVAAMVEEIMDPVLSEVLEPEEAPAGDECQDPETTASTADALRAALTAIRPALARMPRKQRRKVAADIAAKLRKQTGRRAADGKTYAALAAASRRRPAAMTADLGRQIMAKRNPNYRK